MANREWTRAPGHGRKFVQHPGRLMARGELPRDELLNFWCEWEAPSTTQAISNPDEPGPRWLHKPIPASPGSGSQNTDPFVFGAFLYTGCKQDKLRRGGHGRQFTGMRYLDHGSVILFGSTLGGDFVLDTLFVVRTWTEHDASDYRQALAGKVPAAYWDTTLRPWYWGLEDSLRYRLYEGATFEDPVHGMFSFVPCQAAGEAVTGFRRPPIRLAGVINPASKQAPRMNPQPSIEDVIAKWSAVRDCVLDRDLSLGVEIENVDWPVGGNAEIAVGIA